MNTIIYKKDYFHLKY